MYEMCSSSLTNDEKKENKLFLSLLVVQSQMDFSFIKDPCQLMFV